MSATIIYQLSSTILHITCQIIEEKISGKVSWRKRQITKVAEELGNGNSLVISALSQLGRSMLECMEILSIALQRGIVVYSVKGNYGV